MGRCWLCGDVDRTKASVVSAFICDYPGISHNLELFLFVDLSTSRLALFSLFVCSRAPSCLSQATPMHTSQVLRV